MIRRYIMRCRTCSYEYEAEHEFGSPFPSCPKCGGKNYPHVAVHYPTDKHYSIANIKSRVEVATKVVEKDDITEIE